MKDEVAPQCVSQKSVFFIFLVSFCCYLERKKEKEGKPERPVLLLLRLCSSFSIPLSLTDPLRVHFRGWLEFSGFGLNGK